MKTMLFANAIDDALAQAMGEDEKIFILGEEAPALRMDLYVRFGERRVRATPISESGFLGTAVGAAMAGLRPVVEIMLVDFLTIAMDALINGAAKVADFSGGKWRVPIVVRCACGGGYGDGGQHEQSFWGWLAHIPGLAVVVPSTPADAGALMLTALECGGPVVYLEHKLLAGYWLEYLGSGGRQNVSYEVPAAGASGPVPDKWAALPLGKADIRLEGRDLTLVSVGVGVHRCLETAGKLKDKGVSAEVIDLRTIAPLDRETVCKSVAKTGRLLVVDEDYRDFGLSGELAASLMEAGIAAKYGRVCTESTIPYSRNMEDQVLPNVARIMDASAKLLA